MYPNLDFVAHKHHLSQCPTLLGVAPRPLLYLLTNSFVILSFPLWSVKRKTLFIRILMSRMWDELSLSYSCPLYIKKGNPSTEVHIAGYPILDEINSYAYSLLANKPVFAKSVEYQSELPLAVPRPCYQITFKQSGKYFELHRSHKTS